MYDHNSMEDIENLLTGRHPKRIGQEKELHASVLIPLIRDAEGNISILFQVRSSKLPEQPGDICFPGGMAEPGESMQETAIRETTEEMLLHPDQIHLIAPGDILDNGRLKLHSYIGYLEQYQGSYSKEEVEEVFAVPLDWLFANPPETHIVEWKPEMPDDFPFDKIVGGRKYAWRERKEQVLFFPEYEGHVIWGMTAKILQAFLELIR